MTAKSKREAGAGDQRNHVGASVTGRSLAADWIAAIWSSARAVLGLRALEQPLVRRAAVRGAACARMTQKARRPAVLVFAEHGGTDNDDPTFDGFANLTSTLRRCEAREQGSRDCTSAYRPAGHAA